MSELIKFIDFHGRNIPSQALGDLATYKTPQYLPVCSQKMLEYQLASVLGWCLPGWEKQFRQSEREWALASQDSPHCAAPASGKSIKPVRNRADNSFLSSQAAVNIK